jgi:hypothetical protein
MLCRRNGVMKIWRKLASAEAYQRNMVQPKTLFGSKIGEVMRSEKRKRLANGNIRWRSGAINKAYKAGD